MIAFLCGMRQHHNDHKRASDASFMDGSKGDDLMSTLDRIKELNGQVCRRDSALGEELVGRRRADDVELESLRPAVGPPVDEFEAESIIMREGRPVLAIKRDEAQLVFEDPDSLVWQSRLTNASASLTAAAKAVGRIEVEGHSLGWVGTGWLVADDTIVTNRHVAVEFGRDDGTRFVFQKGLVGGDMRASIDLLEEIDREDSLAFELLEILHIEDPSGPDLAFLRVDQIAGDPPPAPIRLADVTQPEELVAVIGYPARDSRIPDVALMDDLFGDVYNKKRLAPGQLRPSQGDIVFHDCTTLGGNSGSVVLSLSSGDAVGLHFAGRFMETNFAVPSRIVARRLEDLRSGRPMRSRAPRIGEVPQATATAAAPVAGQSATLTLVVPLSITVEIGNPYQSGGSATVTASPATVASAGEDGEVFVETVPEDYLDRAGYDASFLGQDLDVPMPTIGDESDVLTFEFNGGPQQELKYEHFSVVMSRSRNLCHFSAVNIDGNQEVEKIARVGWRTDPRIPADAQIRDTCYGNPPRFSRGHMTRREDPNWGTEDSARRGNADSMHVTNAVPQMQPFNGGVWLGLEDYALQNARKDDMKICVFTGPFLAADDPTMFDVQIPVEFWKVIAFVHDDTGKLCATGYTMSQEKHLGSEEIVFGEHDNAQVAISSIEERTGLSFGRLAELDPLAEQEGMGLRRLTDASQIRFV
jgi:endonuclease G